MNNEYGKGSDLFWTRRDGTFFNLDVLNDLTVGNNATVDNNLTVGNDVGITNNLDVGKEMTAANVRGIIDVTAGAENEKEVIMSDFDIIFYHDFLSSRAEISRSTENSPGNTGSDNDLLFRAQKGFWFRPNFNGNAPSITHAEVALHVHIEEEFAVREGAFKVGRDGVLRWPRILDEIPDVADLDLGDIWLAAAEGGLLPDVILAVNKVEEIPTIQMIPFLDLPATPGGPYILNHGIHIVGTLTLTGDFEHEGDLTVTSGAIKGPQIEATGSAANAFYSASGGVTLDAGDILLSTGSLTITSGSISAGGTITGDRIIASSSAANAFYSASGGVILDAGDVLLTSGTLTITAGSISAGGTITGDRLIATSSGANAMYSASGGLTLDTGDILLSSGDVTLTTGTITIGNPGTSSAATITPVTLSFNDSAGTMICQVTRSNGLTPTGDSDLLMEATRRVIFQSNIGASEKSHRFYDGSTQLANVDADGVFSAKELRVASNVETPSGHTQIEPSNIVLYRGASDYVRFARSDGSTPGTGAAADDMYLGTWGGVVMHTDTNDNGISGNKCLQLLYRDDSIMEVDLRGFLRIPLTTSAPSGVSEGAITGADSSFTNSGISGPMYHTPKTNNLEDLPLYDQGSFDPYITDGSGGNFSMTTRLGYWTRIGNLMYIQCHLGWSGKGSADPGFDVHVGDMPARNQVGGILLSHLVVHDLNPSTPTSLNNGRMRFELATPGFPSPRFAVFENAGVGLTVSGLSSSGTMFFSGTVMVDPDEWPIYT